MKSALNMQKPQIFSLLGQKKFIILVLVLIVTAVTGTYSLMAIKEAIQEKEEEAASQTTEKETSPTLPSLPKTGDIKEYIQSQQIDLDGDGTEEAVAIYRDGGNGETISIYKIFFVIFKLKDNRWVKLVDQRLESLSQDTLKAGNSDMAMTEYAKGENKFQLTDLTGDNLPDVLVETQSEGTGAYLGAFIYGVKDKQIQELWQEGPIAKGATGIEKDMVWVIIADYQPDDPTCCPSAWIKTWWKWRDNAFKSEGTIDGNNLEKIKSTPFSESKKTTYEDTTSTTTEESSAKAVIEGSLSYPSEGIPADLMVCAENQETKKLFCTGEKIEDAKYQYHYGYKLEVPPGKYYVYAFTSEIVGYKAYFSEHVICGSLASCPSHEPVAVTIKAGATISGIDPGDWTR